MRIEGTLVDSPGKEQKEKNVKEVQVQKIEVIGMSSEQVSTVNLLPLYPIVILIFFIQYPLQPKKHSMEFLREVAHLRPRTNTFGIVMRVRNAAQNAIHKYFQVSIISLCLPFALPPFLLFLFFSANTNH